MIDNNVAIVQEIQQNLYLVTSESLNLRLGASTSFPTSGKLKRGALVNVESINGNWAYIGNGQWCSMKYLMKIETPSDNLYRVTANSLNIRSGMSTDYSIVGKLKKDDLVKVMTIYDGWALLGDCQWVSAKYLEKYTDDLTWVATTTGRVNMREKATSKSSIIMKIPEGATVEVLKDLGAWFKVEYKGHIGYVSGKYLGQVMKWIF